MARGSSYGEKPPLDPLPETTQTNIPRRATRQLPTVSVETEQSPIAIEQDDTYEYGTRVDEDQEKYTLPARTTRRAAVEPFTAYSYDVPRPHPLRRHRNWIVLFTISIVCVVVGAFVLISAGAFQRSGDPHYMSYPGQSFPIQVGGSYGAFNTWQSSTGPLPAKTPLPAQTGPYSVLGKPTISADFINQVLTTYGSPAAGKGQNMYDLGVKYGIDPVYALAFFMHESLFGTTGEARKTLSLGNLRCIPTRPCVDQDRGGYAQMASWVDGFEQWYKLIRNLYVAQWGRVTVDQIIPKYAPSSDNNNEAAYIASLKHEINTWRAGGLRP